MTKTLRPKYLRKPGNRKIDAVTLSRSPLIANQRWARNNFRLCGLLPAAIQHPWLTFFHFRCKKCSVLCKYMAAAITFDSLNNFFGFGLLRVLLCKSQPWPIHQIGHRHSHIFLRSDHFLSLQRYFEFQTFLLLESRYNLVFSTLGHIEDQGLYGTPPNTSYQHLLQLLPQLRIQTPENAIVTGMYFKQCPKTSWNR